MTRDAALRVADDRAIPSKGFCLVESLIGGLYHIVGLATIAGDVGDADADRDAGLTLGSAAANREARFLRFAFAITFAALLAA